MPYIVFSHPKVRVENNDSFYSSYYSSYEESEAVDADVVEEVYGLPTYANKAFEKFQAEAAIGDVFVADKGRTTQITILKVGKVWE